MIESTLGFVAWKDVSADIVEGQKATFYYVPPPLTQGWAGNAQRIEVQSFRAGRVATARDKSARVYVEFVPRRAKNTRAGVQRSRPNLVIVDGWEHPDPPSGWITNERGSSSPRWDLSAPEWRQEMDLFLAQYLRDHPSVHVLADFRDILDLPSILSGSLSEQTAPQLEVPNPSTGIADATNDPDPWVEASTLGSPEEAGFNTFYIEGNVNPITASVYERNAAARRVCIEHFGPACFVCGFDFSQMYGSAFRGYIHVHHLRPLSEIGHEYVVDPIADLRPVCPNCHAVIHSREPPHTIEEVRTLIGSLRRMR